MIAICGTGMASLAGMLKARGHRVTGSDVNIYPPMSTFLAEQKSRSTRDLTPAICSRIRMW